MNSLLEHAIEKVRCLPAAEQEAAAGLLLEFVGQPSRSLLSDEELDEVRLALREAREGHFASGEELEALWRKFDR